MPSLLKFLAPSALFAASILHAAPSAEEEFRRLSLTWHAAWVFAGVMKGGVEYRPSPSWGVAALGAVESGGDGAWQADMTYRSLSAQFRYYPTIGGSRTPLQVGPALTVWRQGEVDRTPGMVGGNPAQARRWEKEVVSLGARAGAKYVSRAGFTVETGLLYYVPLARRWIEGESGALTGGNGLHLEFGIGWSFF